MFLSGAASLAFETLWFRQAGLVFGNSVIASTLVVAGFMAGLALGTALVSRFGSRIGSALVVYAQLEIAIAVSSVGLVILLPSLPNAFAAMFDRVHEQALVLNAARFLLSFALLLIPATAMGATLPLFVRALSRLDPCFGGVLGLLYGFNTFGAVLGAFETEALLIGHLGVSNTATLAATGNLLAALLALTARRRIAAGGDPSVQSAASVPSKCSIELTSAPPADDARVGQSSVPAWALLAAAFFSGFALLGLEIVWFRVLLLFVFGSSLAFATMLAVVLTGIASGGLLGAHISRHTSSPAMWVGLLALSCVFAVLLPYAHLDGTLRVLLDVDLEAGDRLYVFATPDVVRITAALVLPSCLISGALFTLAGHALKATMREPTRTAGILVFANTSGGALGALAAGLVLLPTLGVDHAILVLCFMYLVAAACVLMTSIEHRFSPTARALSIAATACGLVFVFAGLGDKMRNRYMMNAARPFLAQGMVVEAARETEVGSLLYLRKDFLGRPVRYSLVTDGFGMADTNAAARRYMKLFVYLPFALHPAPREALLISYGLGSTAKALTDTRELSSIMVADISRDVLEMSAMAFDTPGDNPLADPRVEVRVEDGRFLLQTTARRFDIITGEPPPPLAAGVVNLYSREYFQLVHDRLAPGGIASYWLPLHLTGEPAAKSIIAAFCAVFENCSLWEGTAWDWILLGSRGEHRPTEEDFARQWRDSGVRDELRALGLDTPAHMAALFIGDHEFAAKLVGKSAPVTDEYPYRLPPVQPPKWVTAPFVLDVLDVERARDRFQRSAYLRRVLPSGIRRSATDLFETRALVTHILDTSRASPLNADELRLLLRSAEPYAPVLWAFGLDERHVRIARANEKRANESAPIAWTLAIGELAERRFEKALHLISLASSIDSSLQPRVGPLVSLIKSLEEEY